MRLLRRRHHPTTRQDHDMTDTATTYTAHPPRDYPSREWDEDPASLWYVAPEHRDDYARLYPRTPSAWTSPAALAPEKAATLPRELFNVSTDLRDLPELVAIDPSAPPVTVSFGAEGATWLDHRRTLNAVQRLHDPARQAEASTVAAAFIRVTPSCVVCGETRGHAAPTVEAAGHAYPVCDTCRPAVLLALAENAPTLDAARAWVAGLTS